MNIDITPFNDKEQAHGLWEVYYPNGNLWYKRFYHSDKLVGYEEYYTYLGNRGLTEKKYYI